jgi:phosphoenolpyruvate carboxylase
VLAEQFELMIAASWRFSRAGELQQAEAQWETALETMSLDAFLFYREKIAENPDVLAYFEEATPVRELEHARIGSRPARRGERRGLEDLRAIPWGFGWMQSRHVLPAWFGVGFALERFASGGDDRVQFLHLMMEPFPFFDDLINNVEMGLAKADLSLPGRMPIWLLIRLCGNEYSDVCREFARTRRMVLCVSGQSELLQGGAGPLDPLRNPYVDPLSLIQVELLRRNERRG